MTEPVPNTTQEPLLLWTLSFLRPYQTRVALLSVLLLSEIGLGALQPWPLKIVIDYVLDHTKHPMPEPYAHWVTAVTGGSLLMLLVIVVVAGVLLQVANQLVSAYGTQVQVDTGQRMVYDLRYRLFEHLQALGLHHHITTNTGDAVYRVDVDAYAIENLVMSGLFPLATSIITLTVMFVILLKIDVTVALLSLIVVPFLYLCLRYYTSTMVDREERVKELESKLIERLYETFSGDAPRQELRARALRGRAVRQSGRPDDGRAHRADLAAVALLGRRHHDHDPRHGARLDRRGPTRHARHDDGRPAAGGHHVSRRRVRTVVGHCPHDRSVAGRPRRLQARACDVRPASGNRGDAGSGRRDHLEGRIQFEKVGFDYPDGTQVLHDIAFRSQAGRDGRARRPDGRRQDDARQPDPALLRPDGGPRAGRRRGRAATACDRCARRSRSCSQDPVLFSGTIADNLRYGRLDATREEIEQAARAAHAHEFISRLPKGYDTEIAEAGGGLSGGERQRLSVARAILKNAPILILDEPTSSLDAISEEIVFAALRRLRAGRTTIVIAHRSVDGARRRPDSRARRRPDRRPGPARRAAEDQPALSPDVRAPLGRQIARRSGNGRRAHRGGKG